MRYKEFLLEEKNSELQMGIEVEKEHKDVYDFFKDFLNKNKLEIPITLDQFAEMIAKSHIKEMKNYYSKLKKMEG